MATLTIDLPDRLLREARAAGLLAPDVVEAMLRDRLRAGLSTTCSRPRTSWPMRGFPS